MSDTEASSLSAGPTDEEHKEKQRRQRKATAIGKIAMDEKAETSVDVDDFDFEVFQAAMAKVPSQKYDGELMPYKDDHNYLENHSSLALEQCVVSFKETPITFHSKPLLAVHTHSDGDNRFLILTIRFDPVLADSESSSGQGSVSIPSRSHDGTIDRRWFAPYYAQALDMKRKVNEIVESSNPPAPPVTIPRVLIFTGHSGGGAIAQALYYLTVCEGRGRGFEPAGGYDKVDCITFGTPAIVTPALAGTPEYDGESKTQDREMKKGQLNHDMIMPGRTVPGLVLSYINEGDIVALDRRGYISPLLDRTRPRTPAAIPPHKQYEFSGNIILLTDPNKHNTTIVQAVKPDYEKLKQACFVEPLAHRLKEYVTRLGRSLLSYDSVKVVWENVRAENRITHSPPHMGWSSSC